MCAVKATVLTKIEQYVVDRVIEKRKSMNVSQAQLAYHLEVSEGFIANVENPRYRAKYNLNHLNSLAIIFKCSVADFLPAKPFK